MDRMQRVLERLEALYSCGNPPASSADIESLNAELGPLPSVAMALFARLDGCSMESMRACEVGGLRPMPIAEVRSMTAAINQWFTEDGCWLDSIVWFWADDESNYYGVYTDGPCAGYACRIQHDDPDLSPTHPSLLAMLEALVAEFTRDDFVCVDDLPRVYPRQTEDQEHATLELALAQRFLDHYRSSENSRERMHAAYAACSLLPLSETARAIELFEDPDMYIQGYAAELLGQRRWVRGVAALERLARSGISNGYSAALRALVDMDESSDAEDALARLDDTLEGHRHRMLRQMLRQRDRLRG